MLGVDSGPSNLLYHHRSADVSTELRVHVHDLFGAALDDSSDGTCTALFPALCGCFLTVTWDNNTTQRLALRHGKCMSPPS